MSVPLKKHVFQHLTRPEPRIYPTKICDFWKTGALSSRKHKQHYPKAQSEKAKEKRTEGKWCAQKMLKDSMICRREGKRARFASGLARTPLPSRHIVLHFAPPRSGAFLLFRLAFGRVLVGALSAPAPRGSPSAAVPRRGEVSSDQTRHLS